MKEQTCPECGSTRLKYEKDGLVCQECGLIIESNMMFSEDMMVS